MSRLRHKKIQRSLRRLDDERARTDGRKEHTNRNGQTDRRTDGQINDTAHASTTMELSAETVAGLEAAAVLEDGEWQ